MRINMHGSSHEVCGIKNQDACLELENLETGEKVRIICDGCTNINPEEPKTFSKTHSEVGAGLFCSLYEHLENPFDFEKFVQNANEIMEKMLSIINFNKETIANDTKVAEFISHNYCFTVFACFETKDSFIVYHLGDGVILTINHLGVISYIERKYGNRPPYLVYNFWSPENKNFSFTKFVFKKEDFKNVGIASDGLQCILGKTFCDSDKRYVDKIFNSKGNLFSTPENELKNFVKKNSINFSDDVTVVW